MLNFINILTLSTALTTQNTITIDINLTIDNGKINTIEGTVINKDITNQYQVIFFQQDKTTIAAKTITTKGTDTLGQYNYKFIAIGYSTNSPETYAITKWANLNEKTNINTSTYFTNTFKNVENGKNSFTIITRRPYMEELLTALTTAVQSAVSIFVEGFGGLTQIFYNGTEITFIGGILVVGLAVMFLMMFLRWIVSFVKRI